MMTYTCTAYNLTIQSDLPLPELIPLDGRAENHGRGMAPPDVCIRLGAVPEHLEDPTGVGVLYQAGANQFLLKMEHIARYLVQNGNEIIVDPTPGSLDSDVRIFLFGSCFGALLHQRGVLAIHAATIATEHGAALFTGPSGIGKSTLLGAFLRRGYSMMADDVTGIVGDDAGRPLALPAFPRTRLWADAARRLKHDTDAMKRTRPHLEKFEHHVPEQFMDRAIPVWRIYRLTTSNEDEMKLHPLPYIRNFQSVLHNTYRQQFLDGLDMRAPHFKLVSAVAAHASVTRVTRPSHPYRLKDLADMIEEDLRDGAVNGERETGSEE